MELEMPEMRLVGVVGFCCHPVVCKRCLVLALEDKEVTVRSLPAKLGLQANAHRWLAQKIGFPRVLVSLT